VAAGSVIGGCRVESLLGRGGMGVVYRAEQIQLGRPVALKLMAPEVAQDPGIRQRFIAESRLAAAIDHPNILPLYEAGIDAEVRSSRRDSSRVSTSRNCSCSRAPWHPSGPCRSRARSRPRSTPPTRAASCTAT